MNILNELLLLEAMPLAGAKEATEDDVKVQEQPNGSFKVSVAPTSGPLVALLRSIAYSLDRKRGFKVTTKSGTKLPRFDALKANGIIVNGSREELMSAIATAIKAHNNQIKKDTVHKAGAPERRKEDAKAYREEYKKHRQELEAKYGKGTPARVTYKQEGGDDGYQYVVRVDGKPYWNGLTQSEARHYAAGEMEKIAKAEKLGRYAK